MVPYKMTWLLTWHQGQQCMQDPRCPFALCVYVSFRLHRASNRNPWSGEEIFGDLRELLARWREAAWMAPIINPRYRK